MIESLPIWIPLIGLSALGLGVARGAMLRSQSFVPRGRKIEPRPKPPSPVAPATTRARIRQRRPTDGRTPASAQPGLAR